MTSLAVCKSLEPVRSKPPVDYGESAKSANNFSACVSSKWAGNGTPVTSLPLVNGISILVPQAMGSYDIVLDVMNNSSDSAYKLYERLPALTSAFYGESVKGCK